MVQQAGLVHAALGVMLVFAANYDVIAQDFTIPKYLQIKQNSGMQAFYDRRGDTCTIRYANAHKSYTYQFTDGKGTKRNDPGTLHQATFHIERPADSTGHRSVGDVIMSGGVAVAMSGTRDKNLKYRHNRTDTLQITDAKRILSWPLRYPLQR